MYDVEVRRKAEKQIDRLPPDVRQKVLKSLKDLADDPRPRGTKKMKGYDRRYRIRIGD